MSKDLTARLRAAIEQRMAFAEEASPGPWSANAEGDEVVAVDGITVCDGFALSGRQLRATVSHIVANDPETVLRHCQADLRILDWHSYAHECAGPGDNCMWIPDDETCPTVRAIAEGYGITAGAE